MYSASALVRPKQSQVSNASQILDIPDPCIKMKSTHPSSRSCAPVKNHRSSMTGIILSQENHVGRHATQARGHDTIQAQRQDAGEFSTTVSLRYSYKYDGKTCPLLAFFRILTDRLVLTKCQELTGLSVIVVTRKPLSSCQQFWKISTSFSKVQIVL